LECRGKKNFTPCRIWFIDILPQLRQGGGALHGNFQADAQYYFPDSLIGAPEVDEKMLLNSFANFIYENEHFSAGIRFESYYNALLGFDRRYTGSGIPIALCAIIMTAGCDGRKFL
jgi:hypothetical protein